MGSWGTATSSRTHSTALVADVERIIQLGLIIGSDIQNHGEALRGVYSSAGRVQSKLANLYDSGPPKATGVV